jgi:hypothetical protein
MTTSYARKIPLLLSFLMLVLLGQRASGQGLTPDVGGHALLNGKSVMACWNFAAGAEIPEAFSRYAEFLPFLHGWDFRITLPHIQFQLARSVANASEPTMVGVEEDGDITTYGHVNNSLWLFQTGGGDGLIHAKVLPSRRDLNGSATQNVSSLTSGWFAVGSGSPSFHLERPSAVVIGKGFNSARIYLVARDQSGALFMSVHTVTGAETITIAPPIANSGLVVPGVIIGRAWEEAWQPLNISSTVQPALSEAFDGKLALAWVDASSGDLRVQIYTPATGTWGPPTPIAGAAVAHPQLVWDGAALNLLFVQSGTPLLQQTYALADAPLTFYNRRSVSDLVAVHSDQFHALAFNHRLHVVIRQDNGSGEAPVFYTITTTDPGRPASWSIASDTGVTSTSSPQVAWMYENILVAGTSADGRVRYARKDPNRPGNAQTGASLGDRWLQAGEDVDPTAPGSFSGLETLTFNGDVYLAANNSGGGLYLVNFSRAVLKHLMTQKWAMHLLWGEPGGAQILRPGEFGSANEIPALGDINQDGFQDLIRFNQTGNADGNAPVYMHRNFNGDISPNGHVMATDFSHAGEVPMVGDFDGDGVADIINFVQKPQTDFDGGLIGYAPVWVQLSGATTANPLWQDNFSPQGEIPYVGDFNGDGKDDIISFSQKVLTDFDGHLVAQAAVFVCLSDGAHFGPSQLWHTYFSEAGEIPMVGDFNGDGKDDIVTFTQKQQPGFGGAPVWVALSDGTKFGASGVWHTLFSLTGEVPMVGDLNMDGRADIITCIADKAGEVEHPRNIYVAYSLGYKFDNSSTWHSDFVTKNQVRRGPKNRVYSPQISHLGNRTLGDITNVSADYQRPIPDMFAFSKDGSVQIARTMGNVPYPAGAPWERYKFFTDKGLGFALFPEWIYENAGHCIAATHRLALNGLGGVGGGDLTVTSVRYGGRAPHILEELGHSIFANCFRSNKNPFNLFASIFEVPPEQGGIGALIAGPVEALPGCPDPNGFLSCRPDAPGEHYFLQLLSRYRLNPEMFRRRMAQETDATKQANLAAQYQWLKQNWFEGMEFATGDFKNATLEQPGVPLLPDPQPPIGLEVPLDIGSGDAGCGSGAACGSGAPLMLLLTLIPVRRFYRPRKKRLTWPCGR